MDKSDSNDTRKWATTLELAAAITDCIDFSVQTPPIPRPKQQVNEPHAETRNVSQLRFYATTEAEALGQTEAKFAAAHKALRRPTK